MAFKNQENFTLGMNKLRTRVAELESQVEYLSDKLHDLETTEKIHMLRVKNGEDVSDDFIIKTSYYYDLNPEKAFEFYNQKDKDFILLDVSEEGYEPIADFPEVTRIPLEQLHFRSHELPNKAMSILVISEKGLRSILACKQLHLMGFYNINNISGGYKFWPGFHNLKVINPANISA